MIIIKLKITQGLNSIFDSTHYLKLLRRDNFINDVVRVLSNEMFYLKSGLSIYLEKTKLK